MNPIIIQLKELGLTEKQAKIYLALVEIGKGTAYAIAKQAKLKRPITYVILEELRLKVSQRIVCRKRRKIKLCKKGFA
jgi:sugar-specific transcriptional regulator TrmB